MVLSKMLSWVITRLVSWLEEPPPVDEMGDPRVDAESEGECLANREEAPPPLTPPVRPCDTSDKLASEEARRGLPVEVGARERWPGGSEPVA